MPGSLDDLSFTVWPPAIDISTLANPQSFAPQFGVANTSKTATVSLTRALLLVPVTTSGTNLAQNTDMKPNAITSGWTLSGTSTPPTNPGYAAFTLIPDDGEGAIPPGGSVAFTLTGVNVNTVAGNAVLQLQARTSAGLWTPTCQIELTTPSTTPAITRYSIPPANPQTLTTLQGQAVVLNWTTSGAAYCVIEDDQGKKWNNLPTSGTKADTPVQGNAQIQSTPDLARYYNRTFTLTAYAAGAVESDQRTAPAAIQLPTILDFSVTPASLTLGQQATVTWSVANIDPIHGTITLTIDPADGTGTHTVVIPPSQTSGSSVLTPTPQTTTTYTLTVDNGHGATLSASQQVTTSLQPGWQEMTGLETISCSAYPISPMGLFVFEDGLWCWTSSPNGLSRHVTGGTGTSWQTQPTNTGQLPPPLAGGGITADLGRLPPLDGMIVADLGQGERLWAFCTPPFVANDNNNGGIYWFGPKQAPAYPARSFGNYVAGDGTILVLGGSDGNNNGITDVWSTSDGLTWTPVGNSFPESPTRMFGICGHSVARVAGKLQAVIADQNNSLWGYNSSDGGKTWSRTAIPQPPNVCYPPCLVPVGDVLLAIGSADGKTNFTLVMDSTGSWSASTGLSHIIEGMVWAAATYKGCLWLAVGGLSPNLKFFRVNQVLPGTTFTLTPPTNSASQ